MTKTKKKGIICAVFSSLLLVLLLLTSCGTDEQGDVKTDEKGFYSYDGYVVKTDYPLDEDSINKAAEKVKKIYDMYLEGTSVQAYYSIVPDKNFCIGAKAGVDTIDYKNMADLMKLKTDYMPYVDIMGLLDITDYYKTDAHWRQEKVTDVAAKLAEAMGVSLNAEYETKEAKADFVGAYSRQSDLEMEAEPLNYLYNALFDSCKVTDYETNSEMPIYDLTKTESEKGEGYDMFLGGSKSLITIENPNATTDKELVIFRDSFGSSIAPLFAETYSKITMVDIRYLPSEMVGRFVTFDNQDVLFLYSTPVLNNSVTMK
ncbi:MAG: DHHW family protein [Firmicutes bacterium]|nr:DHHW family protein [Bacillota bacterium]